MKLLITFRHKILTTAFLLLPVAVFPQWDTIGKRGFSEFRADYLNFKLNSSGKQYVVFQGIYNKITVMGFDGTIWDTIGKKSFSDGGVRSTVIAFDQNDTPFVVFTDCSRSYKATAMKFDGVDWVPVGPKGFTPGGALCISIAFSPLDRMLYAAFRDKAHNYNASVMRYNQGIWEYVGMPGFSSIGTGPQGAIDLNLVFDKNGIPYVAFEDQCVGMGISVMRFEDKHWVHVGSPGFSPWQVADPSLAIDSQGVPYVSYWDRANFGKITVQKYDRGNWEYVGMPGFSNGPVQYTSLAIDAADNVFVGYMDESIHNKGIVKRFDGVHWINVGDTAVSDNSTYYTNLAIDKNGTAYLAYQDASILPGYSATVKRFVGAGVAASVTESKPGCDFSVFPNPCGGTFNVTYNSTEKIKKIRLSVHNLLGQTLLQEDAEPGGNKFEKQLEFSQYSKGIYFVELVVDEKKEVRKLIVE